MKYGILGDTGIKVSKLCFGALTIGPLQADLPVKKGASLIRRAFEGGVNFIDTAELYGTYNHIADALQNYKKEIVIATKTYAYSREQASLSLEKALREMKRDFIDIFLLHEQESGLTIKGHLPALEFFEEQRQQGKIKAIGISCHTIAAVKAALSFKEIKVIHPIINIDGLGIKDGTLSEMIEAVSEASNRGIGIYGMKPLGGGHLQNRNEEALSYLSDLPFIDSIALGMSTEAEVDYALYFFSGEKVPEEIKQKIEIKKRQLHCIKEECTVCKNCVAKCPQNALSWHDGPVVDENKCIWCGYCGASCPAFCLRII